MAATLEVPIGIHGLTATVSLFPDGSDTPSVNAASLTEATNRIGLYTASVTGLSGLFFAIAQVSGNVVALGWVLMTSSGTCTMTDSRAAVLGLPNAAPGGNLGLATVDANNNVHGLQVGTGTGQLNSSGGKVPATIASGDYSGNTPQTGDAYFYLTTNLGALGAALSAIPKTGFKLASDGLSAISAWTVNITGWLSGDVQGKVLGGGASVITGTGANVNAVQLNAQSVIATGSVTFPATIASPTNITSASGIALAANQHVIVDSGTVTTVTNQLTAAQIATGIWQDVTSGDFTVASSIGKSLYTSGNAPGAANGIALVGSNMGTISGALTASQIATGVWQDSTAGDFTVASSIGKSLYAGNHVPGSASGIALVGSQMDLVNVPNATAITAIQSGIATSANVVTSTATILSTLEGAVLSTNVVQVNGVPTSFVTAVNPVIGTADSPAMTGTKLWTLDGNGNPIATESDLTAVKTVTDQMRFTIPNQIDSNALSGGGGLDAAGVRSAVGLAAANLDAQFSTLESAIAALSALAGTGVYAVSLNVTDGTNPIQNAVVNMTINASSYSGTTNSIGVVVLSPNEGIGTYGIKIRAAGYQFTPTTLPVSGNMSHTYAMTPLGITPSTPPEVTGWLVAYDGSGNPVSGVPHTLQIAGSPNLDVGSSFYAAPITVNSAASTGLVSFPGLRIGASYKLQRGSGTARQFTAHDTGGGMLEIIDVIG